MFLIIGLGNPGKEYEQTYHNMGFLVLDEFAKKDGFSTFSASKKYESLISEGTLGNEKTLLAKPQTSMNNSGKAVWLLTKNYKLPTKNLVVIHDDIDLPIGTMKISAGSGSAGHKGVESIIQNIGTKDFTRIRIGIQPASGKPNEVENFVLKKISGAANKAIFQEVVERACNAIESIIKDNLQKAMSEYNK